MKFTDIFINKPVLAMVVSLFILLLGLRSVTELNVRQFPELQNAVISVSTTYYGADADLIQGFITTPLEREVASAEGIDYLVSTSTAGASNIQAYIRLDYDANQALTQIAAKVNKLRSVLPPQSEDPVVELQQGETTAAMYLSFASDVLDNNQITDYLTRTVEPKLATIPGVQQAQILGAGTFAMRIWLKPERMAALGVTASDVDTALRNNNVLSALGSTKGQMVSIDLTARTDLRSPEEFRKLVIRSQDGAIVRLGDIADVVLGAQNYGASVSMNGQSATFMGIFVAPDANSLEVIKQVRDTLDNEVFPQLPQGMVGAIPYDSTKYIQDAIKEVVKTIIEAVLIVIVVIYLFLGSLRSVLIPAVTVPLSLVGAMFLMLLLGYTINLLTLLAMVLAIGIVVDDAIIVLENIHRHIEEGMKPHAAAIRGARELAWPVVAMTTTLIAVYLPIGFQGGLTGVLFTEFAFSLAGAVLLSGVIALTLTPMMCSTILKPHANGGKGRLEGWLDEKFEKLRQSYQRRLHGALDTKAVIALFGVIIFLLIFPLYRGLPSEQAPQEDQGFIFSIASSDPYTTLDYMERYTAELTKIAKGIPEVENFFLINGFGGGGGGSTTTAGAGFVLKPWSERTRSTQQVMDQEISPKISQISGLNVFAVIPPALPTAGGGGTPVAFVIGGTGPLQQLQELSDEVLAKARESKKFIFLDKDLKIDKPRVDVQIDRDKAGLLGIDMRTLSADMSALLSGGYTNLFALDNRSYRVIPQVQREDRLNASALDNYYTRTKDGKLIPLSTLISFKESAQPQQLKRFQQLNAVTISGVPRPGVTLGQALDVLDQAAAEVLPPGQGYSVDYSGESRQFKQEGQAFLYTLLFALVVIFLVLSAQFESFRDALIMLLTVPMAISGALLTLTVLSITNGMQLTNAPGATINIYTLVGLVTLVGVISKHGILIVEFANKLQIEQGLSKREAIEEATGIRLRPVLMTTSALVFAMVPLLTAHGPGAASRFSLGVVIASGMLIGTLFTLFVLPAFYLYLARDHAHDREAAAAASADEADDERLPPPQPEST